MEKTNSQYEILKKKTDQTISDEVRRFINGEIDPEGNEVPEKQRVKLRGVWLQPDSKRYYLYSSLASGVIGFVNGDGIGSVPLLFSKSLFPLFRSPTRGSRPRQSTD